VNAAFVYTRIVLINRKLCFVHTSLWPFFEWPAQPSFAFGRFNLALGTSHSQITSRWLNQQAQRHMRAADRRGAVHSG